MLFLTKEGTFDKFLASMAAEQLCNTTIFLKSAFFIVFISPDIIFVSCFSPSS